MDTVLHVFSCLRQQFLPWNQQLQKEYGPKEDEVDVRRS